MTKKKKSVHHHIDKRLRLNLWIFAAIAIVMLSIVVFDIAIGMLSAFFALAGIGVGIIIGIASTRMFHYSWNHDVKKVISRLDWIGGFILVGYIALAIFRSQLIDVFINGPQLAPVGFATITGTMIGRVIGMRREIVRVLKEQKIL